MKLKVKERIKSGIIEQQVHHMHLLIMSHDYDTNDDFIIHFLSEFAHCIN
jgi:hypothetical protein